MTVIALVSAAGNATATAANAAVARREKALKKCIEDEKLEWSKGRKTRRTDVGDDNSQRGGLYSGKVREEPS